MATTLLDIETPIYPLDECKRFIQECLQAVGATEENASQHADLLVAADYKGHYSHGMNRLEMYISEIELGAIDPKAVPEILQESPSTAWVDGNNTLGAVVGNFCMELAMKKAKEVGVGWVCAKGSSHYGIAAWYPLQAVKQGLIGFSCTNSSPFMVPTRAREVALGTNPLSFAAPAKDNDSFVLDMATTVVAVGKVEIQKRKDAPIPEGWAMDSNGVVTTDAEVALTAQALLPLGGVEEMSSYKGYGLGLMVDTISGVLAGSLYSNKIKQLRCGSSDPSNLGQCFIALDPKCFAPDFEDRMTDIMNIIRTMDPVDPNKPIYVHGDKERLHMKAVDAAGGIKFLPKILETCDNFSKKFNVAPMHCKCKKSDTCT